MEPFKIEIECKKEDSFGCTRDINYSCESRFIIREENVYAIKSIDYSSESVIEYYALCPICGRINKIDEEMLPEDIKKLAVLKYQLEPFQYQKNNLRSKLTYLDMISPPKVRARTK